MMCFILQSCVFDYKKEDAIRQCTVINNAMIDVIKAVMQKDSNWIVKVSCVKKKIMVRAWNNTLVYEAIGCSNTARSDVISFYFDGFGM